MDDPLRCSETKQTEFFEHTGFLTGDLGSNRVSARLRRSNVVSPRR